MRIVLYNHGNLKLAHSSRETAGHVESSIFADRKGFVSRVGQKEQETPRRDGRAEMEAGIGAMQREAEHGLGPKTPEEIGRAHV